MSEMSTSGLVFFPEIDSTNTYTVSHFESLADGTLVAAGAQSAGRGRQGRVWVSPAGKNIYATLAVKTPGKPFLAGAVVGLAGLALARKLVPDAQVFLKWPNDIYIQDRKLAGILCEGAGFRDGCLVGVAAGIGINVNLSRQELDLLDQPATSLAAEAGTPWDLSDVLQTFYALTQEYYVLYRQDQAQLFRLWKKENRLIGHTLSFQRADGTVFTGTFTDIAPEGEMMLTLPDGTVKTLHCGDVRIRRDSLPSF